jgi:hypothetical protein
MVTGASPVSRSSRASAVVVAGECPDAGEAAPRCTTIGAVSYRPSVTSTSLSDDGFTSCAATTSPSPRSSCRSNPALSRTTMGTSFSFCSRAKRLSNSYS